VLSFLESENRCLWDILLSMYIHISTLNQWTCFFCETGYKCEDNEENINTILSSSYHQ
jgi:hypothetical protein